MRTLTSIHPSPLGRAPGGRRPGHGTKGQFPVPLCTEDHFFPPDFMRRVVAERLRTTPDEIAAGHCVALSRPKKLATLRESYANAAAGGARVRG